MSAGPSFIGEALERALPAYPLSGRWLHEGPDVQGPDARGPGARRPGARGEFPPRVILLGVPFQLARWKQRLPGVLAQYREACPCRSMHAKVVRDRASGRLYWVVDHEDLYNPDQGHPLAHFFHDYEPGRIARPAAVALAGLALTKTFVG